jgi:hypothetical protein
MAEAVIMPAPATKLQNRFHPLPGRVNEPAMDYLLSSCGEPGVF